MQENSMRLGLQQTPRLLARLLVWRNRWARVAAPVRVLTAVALPAVTVCAAVAAAEIVASGDSRRGLLERHRLLLAVIAACIAASLVARRRAIERSDARRSWLAALPVGRSRARWESLVIACAPACVMLMVVPLIALVAPHAAIALLGGILVGAVVGYLIPETQVVDLPPGSRYVPHRRLAPKVPVPSLSALGLWPVRRLFASLRPQAVTRAAIPLLLVIPMGAKADAAMLMIGILVALAATALLVAAMLAVSKAATRWLLPLPLRPGTIAAQVLMRPLVVIGVLAAVTGWLVWVSGVTPQESARRGLSLFLVAALSAVGGSLLLIKRASRGGS